MPIDPRREGQRGDTDEAAGKPPLDAGGRRPRSPRRKVAFVILTAAGGLLLLELLAQIAFAIIRTPQWEENQGMLARVGFAPTEARMEIAHPYVGAVHDARNPPKIDFDGKPAVVNGLGFPHPTDPIQKRGRDRYIVAVTGGSVALHLLHMGGEALVRKLKQVPALSDREIVLVCAAFGAYKQPQQLMTVNYFASLGAEYDLLINLDGFNEIALTEIAYCRGMSPAFPRAWAESLGDLPDPESQIIRFQIWRIRADRQELARSVLGSWARWSALRQLWWKAHDASLSARQSVLIPRLMAEQWASRDDYRSYGPPETFATDAAMYARFVEIWRNSSLSLHHWAEGAGCLYLHCLQPNQYDPGAKPLSAEELEIAYNEESDWRHSVVAGYDLLREGGRELKAKGVRFYDLTGVFRDRTETLYGDDCCHLVKHGCVLLADEIGSLAAAAVQEHLQLTRK